MTVWLGEGMLILKMVTKLYELYQWRGDDFWVMRRDACSRNGHKIIRPLQKERR